MDSVALKAMKQRASLASRSARRDRQIPAFRGLFESTARKEAAAIREIVQEGLAALEQWAEVFYPTHQEEMRGRFEPAVFEYGLDVVELALEEIDADDPVQAELFAAQYTRTLTGRWVGSSKAQIFQIVRDEDEESAADVIAERMAKWSEQRPVWSAQRESTQAGGAFAKLAYLTAGVTELVWRTSGGACPICAELEGRVIAITEPFVRAGEEVGPSGDGETPIRPEINIGHPPLHGLDGRGGVCQCLIAAA